MIVVGIMGIVLTMSVPIVWKVWHRAPLVQALRDIQEVCKQARDRAILQGQQTDVIFYPLAGRLEVAAGSAGAPAGVSAPARRPGSAAEIAAATAQAAPAASGSGHSAQISNQVSIDMLDVNLTEYKDAEQVHVRFYPNGTCDELTIIIHDTREWKKIYSEITTGLINVEDFR